MASAPSGHATSGVPALRLRDLFRARTFDNRNPVDNKIILIVDYIGVNRIGGLDDALSELMVHGCAD